jgi:hypothetical protein
MFVPELPAPLIRQGHPQLRLLQGLDNMLKPRSAKNNPRPDLKLRSQFFAQDVVPTVTILHIAQVLASLLVDTQ